MGISTSATIVATAVVLSLVLAGGAEAQSTPTEHAIIDALLPSSASGEQRPRTRSMSGGRGVSVSGGAEVVPSIDSESEFRVRLRAPRQRVDADSRRARPSPLEREASRVSRSRSWATPMRRARLEYNDALSQRRAAAVVGYLVRNFTLDDSLLSSKGMGERQLLDKGDPDAGSQPAS